MQGRFLLAAVALIWTVADGQTAVARQVDLELILAADISGSMDRKEARLQRQGFVNALRHRDVIAAIRSGRFGRIAVAYVEWAGPGVQRVLVNWTELSDAKSAARFAEAVGRPQIRTEFWTSISALLDTLAPSFDGNGFDSRRRIIDISGDGPNNKGDVVAPARDRAVSAGITINGLPIINQRPGPYRLSQLLNLDAYFEDCVIGGPGAFVIVADGFKDFARAIRRKLILEISGVPPPPKLIRAAAKPDRPPCNAGELQIKGLRLDHQ